MKGWLLLAMALLATPAVAQDKQQPNLLFVYKTIEVDGHTRILEIPAALVNMSQTYDGTDDDCEELFGVIKVQGIQFSPSGATLHSFRFTDANGYQWSVPTHIGRLSDVARDNANSFIRVGKRYFAEVRVCGSGGFASLVNLYDINIKFAGSQ